MGNIHCLNPVLWKKESRLSYSKEACQSLLLKSQGKFRSAELSFREGLYDSAVSDLYYSAFQTISALMVLRGVSIHKHTYVRSYINKELGLKGIVSLDLVKMYNILMTSREDADYKPNVFHDKEFVSDLLNKVKRWNNEIRTLIDADLQQ